MPDDSEPTEDDWNPSAEEMIHAQEAAWSLVRLAWESHDEDKPFGDAPEAARDPRGI